MPKERRVTLDTVILITRYAVSPICCWPEPMGAKSSVILRRNMLVTILSINLIFNMFTSLSAVYENRHDIVRVIKILSETIAASSALAKMLICKLETPRLQYLLGHLQTFMNEATQEEKELIQSYVDKCLSSHTLVFVSIILGPTAFLLVPTISAQVYPVDVLIPFDDSATWTWACLYVSQSICIVQVGSMVIVDVLFAIIIWYAGARFQALSMNLKSVTTVEDVMRCVRTHQELLRYTDEMRHCTQIIAVEVNVTAVLAFITGGFILTRNPTKFEIAKYLGYEIASAMELFLYSWPADNLMEQSRQIADAIYNCEWIGKSEEMLRDVMIVMQRSQKPNVITVRGLLPVLSLETYSSTMAATFSYLTTLRAMAE